ncbi:MAG TPA: TetR/AcrR family transcriptional regulator [Caulobacteraceae bacterium]
MTDQNSMPTADRLVMAAMTLFAEKGYISTSVADILREAGANSGSLYHAFPTKQDLLLEVLRRYRDGIGPMLLEPAWAGVDDPVERIFALLAAYRGMLARTDCLYGCPIGSLALELHEPDPPVRELLAINFDGWTGAIEACLAAASEVLPRDANSARLARFVLTVMEGGVMQSRTHRSLDAFDACVDTLRDYFNRLREAAGNEAKPGETP